MVNKKGPTFFFFVCLVLPLANILVGKDTQYTLHNSAHPAKFDMVPKAKGGRGCYSYTAYNSMNSMYTKKNAVARLPIHVS
jgi:hypothetical protein